MKPSITDKAQDHFALKYKLRSLWLWRLTSFVVFKVSALRNNWKTFLKKLSNGDLSIEEFVRLVYSSCHTFIAHLLLGYHSCYNSTSLEQTTPEVIAHLSQQGFVIGYSNGDTAHDLALDLCLLYVSRNTDRNRVSILINFSVWVPRKAACNTPANFYPTASILNK